jgi:hypothetical protein
MAEITGPESSHEARTFVHMRTEIPNIRGRKETLRNALSQSFPLQPTKGRISNNRLETCRHKAADLGTRVVWTDKVSACESLLQLLWPEQDTSKTVGLRP